jgi:hypothetical protein
MRNIDLRWARQTTDEKTETDKTDNRWERHRNRCE